MDVEYKKQLEQLRDELYKIQRQKWIWENPNIEQEIKQQRQVLKEYNSVQEKINKLEKEKEEIGKRLAKNPASDMKYWFMSAQAELERQKNALSEGITLDVLCKKEADILKQLVDIVPKAKRRVCSNCGEELMYNRDGSVNHHERDDNGWGPSSYYCDSKYTYKMMKVLK